MTLMRGFLLLVLLLIHISAANAFTRSEDQVLFAPMPNRPGRIATGGFSSDLKIFSKFATYTDLVRSEEIESLMTVHKSRLTAKPRFQQILKTFLSDRYIFEAFSFFMNAKGKLWAGKSGGHYRDIPFAEDPDRSLIIMVGLKNSDESQDLTDREIKRTALHELLHYVFDQMDAAISEFKTTMPTDHFVIDPLEERLSIIDSILNGEYPVTSNRMGLKLDSSPLVRDRDFLKRYVAINMESARRSTKEARKEREEGTIIGVPNFEFSKTQLRDLEWLWAYNGKLLQLAYKIAVQFNPQDPKRAFSSEEARGSFMGEVRRLLDRLDQPGSAFLK